MAEAHRPLSPHLQIYRWQVSNTLSILHRLTGVGLSLGALGLVSWLLAAAGGAGSFGRAAGFFGSGVGRVLLAGWSFAFFFHLCNGLRHLAWDGGFGFDKHRARKTGWTAVAAAALLTIIFWSVALTGGSAS